MKYPGALSLTLIVVTIACRFAVRHTTGRTLADYLIAGFEVLVKFGVASAFAMRAAQRQLRETMAGFREEAMEMEGAQ